MFSLLSDLVPASWPSLPSRSTFRLAFAALVVLVMAIALALTATGSLTSFYAWFDTIPWWQQTSLATITLTFAGIALYLCIIDLLIPDLDDEDD